MEVDTVMKQPPKCLSCGGKLPNRIERTDYHKEDCAWNFVIECEKCEMGNNLGKLLGFWSGCSKACENKQK